MGNYLSLVPTAFIVLASFGALFVLLAALARMRFGARAVWPLWAVYLVVMSASCIYKLSGLRYGFLPGVAGRTVYLSTVAVVAFGVPLALSASIIARPDYGRDRMSVGAHVASAWLACIVATPIAVVLVAIVDRIYASI
jgi:hypothetical protein